MISEGKIIKEESHVSATKAGGQLRSIKSSFAQFLILAIATCFVQHNSSANGNNPFMVVSAPEILYLAPDSKNVSVLFKVRNTGTEPAQLVLKISDFKSKTTGNNLGTTVRLFDSEKASAQPLADSTNLAVGQEVTVRAEISNVWEAGEAEAKISSGTNELWTFRSIRDRVPFTLKLLDSDVVFQRGSKTYLQIKNDDPMTYVFDWRLRVRGASTTGSNVIVNPNSIVEIPIEPLGDWFEPIGQFIKDDIANASLFLSFHPPSTLDSPNWPRISLASKAKLSRTIPFISELVTLVILFLGAACSLFLNIWVPNQLKKAELKDSMSEVRTRIHRLSNRIESRPRVAADVQLKAIEREMNARAIYSADLPKELENAGKDLDFLKQRIEQLEEIDRLLLQIEEKASEAPTPFLLTADKLIRSSAEVLSGITVCPADLEKSAKLIGEADAWFSSAADQQRLFAQDLAARIKTLVGVFARPAANDTYEDLRVQFQKLLQQLTADNCDPTKILQSRYSELYIISEALDLLRSYVEGGRSTDPDKEKRILSALGAGTCDGLREAQSLIAELRGAPTDEQIKAEIQAKKLDIEINSPVIRQNDTIQLSIHFGDPRFNVPEVRNRLKVHWDFGHDSLSETGWSVAHYFPMAIRYRVAAKFQDSKGVCLKDDNNQEITVSRELSVGAVPKRGIGERSRVELVQLAIVLLIALLGLLAGAREQLAKLDLAPGLIAIFLLGFSADSIKNLLTKK